MASRNETRGQVTYKHAKIDNEFTTAVRLAAGKLQMSVGEFVVETLRARATDVLKRGPDDGSTPASTPPARLEDVVDVLGQKVAEAVAAASERLAREQAQAIARIEESARRGRWRR